MTEHHQTLVAVKAYLLNHGWRQDDYGFHGGPRCILGACRSVRREDTDIHPVAFFLRSLVGATPDIWNDAPKRTFDDVIALLDRAILATAPAETLDPSPSVPVHA